VKSSRCKRRARQGVSKRTPSSYQRTRQRRGRPHIAAQPSPSRCRRDTRVDGDRSAAPLVHGDLVGGEYGCDKRQTRRADEPRPPPNGLRGATDSETGQPAAAAVPVRATGGIAARPVHGCRARTIFSVRRNNNIVIIVRRVVYYDGSIIIILAI